jgi:pimeloyl-ACP methyl ester carboxylesterase
VGDQVRGAICGRAPVNGTEHLSDNPLRDDLVGLAVSGVAQAHPGRVRGLVMSDSPFGSATAALAEWAGQMAAKIPAGFAVLEHRYAADFGTREPALFHLYNALNRLNPSYDGARDTSAYGAWQAQPPADYGTFSVPTLFIVGTEDELTLPWLMRATAEAVNGAQLVEIDGAGHSGYAERADVFNDAVLRFCSTLAP